MRLYVASDLPVDPLTAWSIFESKEFETRLEGATDVVVELIDERVENGHKLRRLKYRSKRELPTIVQKALGAKALSWEQHNRFDPAKSQLAWTVVLPVMTDRVKAAGTTTITPTATGSRRVVDGDITVEMRLVGGQIEKAVVAEFERSMLRAVDVARSLMSAPQGSGRKV